MSVDKGKVGLLVAALRSGEYSQGTGKLCRIIQRADGTEVREWCCLGVASDVAMKFGVDLQVTQILFDSMVDGGSQRGYAAFDGADAYMPPKVMEWYGFEVSNPILDYAGGTQEAAHLNDSGKDFSEIAQLFEDTFIKE